jgi:hypothetical protein
MCKERDVQRGLLVVSHIDGRRSCQYRVGDKKPHSVKVTNLTPVECWVGITAHCLGQHVRASDGATWSQPAQRVEPRRTVTFSGGELLFVDSDERRLPADEDVKIAIGLKRDEADELEPYIGSK